MNTISPRPVDAVIAAAREFLGERLSTAQALDLDGFEIEALPDALKELGVLPLALASGAGSGSQNAIGVGVMGGMISATVLAIFFVPVFFVAVLKLVARWAPKGHQGTPEPAQAD